MKGSLFLRRGLVAVGLICWAALVEANAQIIGLETLWQSNATVQMALLCGAVIGLAWGFSGTRPIPQPSQRPFKRALWPLVGILLLGAAVRLWHLENAVHFHVDEANFLEGIYTLREGRRIRLLAPFNYIAAFTWIYPYLQDLASQALGANLSALRVVSGVFGLLTIPAVYRLGMALFNRRIGLIAAFVLAVFPPHVHFSRIGLNNIADPLFGVLGLAFLVSGMRKGKRAHIVLAGVMLGLTQYFYEGGRLLFPALALCVMGVGAVAWRPKLRPMLWTVGLAVLLAMPVYLTLNQLDAPTATRLERRALDAELWVDLLLSTSDQGRIFRERIGPPLAHFITAPDDSEFYYGGQTALVLPALLPILTLGLVWGLWRSAAAWLILLSWVMLTVLGNSLIFDNGWSARFVVAFPAIALFLALGLDSIMTLFRRMPFKPTLQHGLSLALLAAVGFGQMGYYFGPHLTLYNRQIRPEHDQQDIMFRARDWPQNTHITLITDDYIVYPPILIHMMRYWGIEHELLVLHPREVAENLNITPEAARDYAFFIEQDDTASLTWLQTHWPDVEVRGLSPYNVPQDKQYLLLYVSQGSD